VYSLAGDDRELIFKKLLSPPAAAVASWLQHTGDANACQ